MSQQEVFIEGLLDETREEINRADSKANILLAGSGVAAAILGGSLLSGDLTLDGERGAVQTVAILGAVMIVSGVMLLGAAVFPRIGKPAKGRARYFMEHAQYDDLRELRSALAGECDDPSERHLSQLRDLARIVHGKYQLTRWGQVTTALGLLMVGIATLLHFLLGA